jgi:MFS family permease
MMTGSNRWLLPVLLNSALIQGAVYVVRPMITYRAVDLGADAALVGLVGATFALAPLIFAIQIGRWTDRGNAGKALFFGTSLSVFVTFALLFIESIPLLALAMPVLGIGHLLVMTGGQTMIANESQDKQYERNFGLLTFYASLGHALGPLIGGYLADRGVDIDVNAALLFALGLFIVATLGVIPVLKQGKLRANRENAVSGFSLKQVLDVKGFKSAIFVSGSITAVVDVMLIFLPLLGREVGMSASQVGILLAIRAVASMGVRLVLGPMSSKWGMRKTLHFGSALTLASAVAIALLSDFALLAIVMVFAGFAMGIGQPVTMAWVSRISNPSQRGLAISIRLTSNRLGQVVVPAIAGTIALSGVGTVFWMLAALQAASLFVTEHALGKDKDKPLSEESN